MLISWLCMRLVDVLKEVTGEKIVVCEGVGSAGEFSIVGSGSKVVIGLLYGR